MAIMSVGTREFHIEESYAEFVARLAEACERYVNFIYVTRRGSDGTLFEMIINVHRINMVAPECMEIGEENA